MAIFLTSDLHLGHARVAEIRGFLNVQAHDAAIIRNLSKLPAGSTLFILGDVAMGGWKQTILPLGNLIMANNLSVHVVLGNHDRPAPNNSNGHAHVDSFWHLGRFDSVATVGKISYGGTTWLMSHYPYDGDHTAEERYDQYRLRDLEAPLFHGHTHSNERLSFSNKGTPQVHVGLDAWGLKPVSLFDAVSTLGN